MTKNDPTGARDIAAQGSTDEAACDIPETQLERLVAIDLPPEKKAAEPSELPISPYLERILQSVEEADVTIVSAALGAGKSSQVTQVLARAGYVVDCTQPTIVAAMSLAQ